MTLPEREQEFLPALVDGIRDQLAKYNVQVNATVAMANSIDIRDQATAEMAISFAGEARKMKARIEKTKLAITEPYRDFVSDINALAKSYTERLEQVSKAVEFKLTVWKSEEHNKTLARDISAELEGSSDSFSQAIADIRKIRTKNCSAHEKDVWKYEVKDIFDVPIGYLEVNDNSVQLSIKNGVRSIPGLRIYKETVTQLRSR
jgi:hypothetical protein